MIPSDPLLLPNTLIMFFILAMLVMAVINMRNLKNLNDYKKLGACPRVSLLVPARDEEKQIGQCVKSLLAQDYPDFQVIVLDDNSRDRTGEVLEELGRSDSRLKVIRGKPLPLDWLGKHWACHQLYLASDGDLILFTDSDTVHSPDTLRCAVSAMMQEGADMISIMPRHIMVSWAEKLIMPIFALGVFAVVPLRARFRPKKTTILSSSGKLMMFRRKSYAACGGFEEIRQNVLDDLQLPQRIIAAGLRYRLFDGTNNVSCRMYYNLKEVHQGLAKNMFAAYDYNVPLFSITWLWILFAMWEPIIVLAIFKMPQYPPTLSLGLSAISIIGTILIWCIYYQRFKFPMHTIIFYPVSALMMAAISASSMVLTLSGRATWKDRKLPKQKMY
ncbi:MAG: glycosyltransferase [Dehalococcoidia bacterium]